MGGNDRERSRVRWDPDRGVSEVIGVALLFGFVVAGAALVVVTGTTAQERISEQSRYEAAVASVNDLDASLTDLTVRDDSSAVAVDITERIGDAESVRVDTGDELTIRFDDGSGFTSACEATVPLDRVDYEVNDDTVVSYQAGGVFVTQSGTTLVDTPPDVGLTEGTVKSSVFDLPSDLDHEFTASRDVAGSVQQTKQALTSLFATSDCKRPDGVKLIVEGDRTEGWERYFESSLGDVDGVTVATPAPGTVEVEMPQDVLLDAVNDSRNTVVAFNESGPDTYGEVVTNGSGVDIVVDKPGDDNGYGLTTQLLGGDVGYNESHRHETEVPVYKWIWEPGNEEPLDVVFLMDESGSMSSQQISDTESAVKQFTSRLQSDNKSHKAALIGYSGDHSGNTKIHQGLTSNLDDVKSAVSLSDDGGTPMDDGLDEAMSELGQDPDRSQVIIMMTDGKPNGGDSPYDPSCGRPVGGSTSSGDDCPVADAIDEGYTVYTVTFGDDGDVNKDLMRDVAEDTGAEYDHVYEGEGDSLDDTFENLIGKGEGYSYKVPDGTDTYYITDVRGVLHEPVTLTHAHDNATWGDTGSPVDDAVHGEYGESVVEAPGRLTDGETLTTEAERYTCDVNNSGQRTPVDREWGYETNNSSAAQYPYNSVVQGQFEDHYNEYRCAAGAASTHPTDPTATVSYGVAGDSVTSLTDGDSPVSWQAELPDIVDPYTSGGTLDLKSNQVIVVYEFDDQGTHDTNGLVVLYEVGHSTEFEVSQVLDLDVTEVEEST